MKRGLLIHSYNCNEPNWEHTIWGYPPDKPGRLVTAVKVILEENIDVALTCGTAGEKEGRKECWWIRDYLYEHLEQLRNFTIYPVLQQHSAGEIKEVLDRVLVVREKDSGATTAVEAEYAGKFFAELGVNEIFVVSSLDHISRCLRDNLANWLGKYPALAANVYGTQSLTFYSERMSGDKEIAKVGNVVIIEPPFYGSVGGRVQRMFKLRDNLEALKEIDVVFQKYGV